MPAKSFSQRCLRSNRLGPAAGIAIEWIRSHAPGAKYGSRARVILHGIHLVRSRLNQCLASMRLYISRANPLLVVGQTLRNAAFAKAGCRARANLAETLAAARAGPRVFISASAIGYYGDRGEETLREESSPGTGFLPEVCREWEAAAEPATKAGIRTAQMRFGVVLSTSGGALQKDAASLSHGSRGATLAAVASGRAGLTSTMS